MKKLLSMLLVFCMVVSLVAPGIPVHAHAAEIDEGTAAAETTAPEAPEDTVPAETEPVETEPAETEPVETEPVETESAETEPAETEAEETEPAETEAQETEPEETEAEETLSEEVETFDEAPADPEISTAANGCTVTASSSHDDWRYYPGKAIDGQYGYLGDANGSSEWVAGPSDTVNPWLTLTWEKPQTVTEVRVYGRPGGAADPQTVDIIFNGDESSKQTVNAVDGNLEAAVKLTTPVENVTSIKFSIVNTGGNQTGFDEVDVYGYETPAEVKTKCAAPTNEIPSGEYSESVYFKPSTTTEGAKIMYRELKSATDSKNKWYLFQGSRDYDDVTVVEAYAYMEDGSLEQSDVVTFTYVINKPDQKCGDNLTWKLSADAKTLTIEGSGDMYNFSDYQTGAEPWTQRFSEYVLRGITTLVLPEGITSIGDYAFGRCYGMEGDLIIPDGVTYIGQNAFDFNGYEFDTKYRLELPDSLVTIGDDAFGGCGFTGSLTIPSGVTSIGASAFKGCEGFTGDLVLPEGLTTIGSCAFMNCKGITGKLVIPASIEQIDDAAFDLSFSKPLNFSGIEFGTCQGVWDKLWADGKINADNEGLKALAEKSITYGDHVDADSDGLCDACGACAHIKDADGFCTVANCPHIAEGLACCEKKVVLEKCGDSLYYAIDGGKLTITGTGAMWDFCDPTGSDPDAEGRHKAPWWDEGISSVTFEEGITHIGREAFATHGMKNNLTGVVNLPDSLISIGENAFASNKTITGFNEEGKFVMPANLQTIGDYAFQSCQGVNGELVLNDGLLSIGKKAFNACPITGDLVIPNTVTTIGQEAFLFCRFDGDVYISNHMTVIPKQMLAFTSAPPVQSTGRIHIPASVKTIENGAFDIVYGFTNFNATKFSGIDYEGCEGMWDQITIDYSKNATIKKLHDGKKITFGEHADVDSDGLCDDCGACAHIKDADGFCTVANCPHIAEGLACCEAKGHIHDGVEYAPFDPETLEYIEDGHFYLTEDTVLTEEIFIAQPGPDEAQPNVTLCLNGHSLTAADGGSFYVEASTLTICDCAQTAGTLTLGEGGITSVGTVNLNGVNVVLEGAAAVSMESYGVEEMGAALNINDAVITGTSEGNSNIYVGSFCTLNMNSGSITTVTNAINVDGGTANIKGGSITSQAIAVNVTKSSIVNAPKSTVNVSGGELNGAVDICTVVRDAIHVTGYTGAALSVDLYGAWADGDVIASGVTSADQFTVTGTDATYVNDKGQLVVGVDGHFHDGVLFEDFDPVEFYKGGSWKLDGGFWVADSYVDSIVNGKWTLPADMNICLNDNTLWMNKTAKPFAGDYSIVVPAGITLNIYDCSGGKEGRIIGEHPGFLTVDGGTVNIYGGYIVAEGDGQVIVNSGELNLIGGEITSDDNLNHVDSNDCVMVVNGGTVNVKGGTVEATGVWSDFETGEEGGAAGIRVNGGKLNITGGTFATEGDNIAVSAKNAIDVTGYTANLTVALEGEWADGDVIANGVTSVDQFTVTGAETALKGNQLVVSVHTHAFGDWTVTTPATCTEKGEETRTCECGETETREVAALGHKWGEPIWAWTDSFEATAYFTCENDEAHEEALEATVTGEVTTEPGVGTPGEKTYTATVVLDGVTYTDTSVEELPALGHIHDGITFEEFNPGVWYNGGSYTLDGDWMLNPNDPAIKNNNLILKGDLNLCLIGNTLWVCSPMSGDFTLTVPAGVTFNIYDCTGGREGRVLGSIAKFLNIDGGTVNVYGGHIVAEDKGQISITNNGQLNLYGGTITCNDGLNNTTNSSYLADVKSGSFNVYGGLVENSGPAVQVSGGSFRMEGGKITSKDTKYSAISVKSGTADIVGGEVAGSMCALDAQGGTVNISGGKLDATFFLGCGVKAQGGTINITDGEISGTSCGAAAMNGPVTGGVLNISGGTISGTGTRGNGVQTDSVSIEGWQPGTANISGGTITGKNFGVYAYSSGTVHDGQVNLSGNADITGTKGDIALCGPDMVSADGYTGKNLTLVLGPTKTLANGDIVISDVADETKFAFLDGSPMYLEGTDLRYGERPVHEHTFGDWTVTTPATCTEKGEETRTCDCGESETREVAALGHTEVIDAAVPATCTEPGKTEGKHCSVCETVIVAQEEVPALGHDFGEWTVTKEPAEGVKGQEKRTCSRCDAEETREIPALKHTHDGVVFEDFDPVEFYKGGSWKLDGGFWVADSYVDSIVNGKWTLPADMNICLNDNTLWMNKTAKPFAGDYSIVVPAGITLNIYDCSGGKEGRIIGEHPGFLTVDGGTVNIYGGYIVAEGDGQVIVNSGELNLIGGEITSDDNLPNNTTSNDCVLVVNGGTVNVSGGTVEATGVNVDFETEEEVGAIGVRVNGGKLNITGGTFATEGDNIVTSVKNAIDVTGYTEKLSVALEGEWADGDVIANGVTSADQFTVTGAETALKGNQLVVSVHTHAFGDWTVTTPATCTEKGEETRTCECGETETREIEALGHDYAAVVTEPTCTEKGFTTHTCSRCDDSYVDSYVDALGHDFGEWTESKAATCTEKGEERRDCARCDEFETREIEALGHDYAAVVIEPTCTEKGFTTHTCSRCDDSYKDTFVDALGHDFGEWTESKAATCTEKGEERRDCSRCDEFETRETEALGHAYGEAVWTWNDDFTASVTFTCANDETHVETVEAVVESEVTTEPACETEGERTYTATAEFGEETYTDTATEVIPAKGHNFEDGTCTDCGEKDPNALTALYRVYNPFTQEHLMVTSEEEIKVLTEAGWILDGLAWFSPAEGTPVYRLYNQFENKHFYSMNEDEVKDLEAAGWIVDGVLCFSATAENGRPVYRLYNQFENTHLFTIDDGERESLLAAGWNDEGVAWYAANPEA